MSNYDDTESSLSDWEEELDREIEEEKKAKEREKLSVSDSKKTDLKNSKNIGNEKGSNVLTQKQINERLIKEDDTRLFGDLLGEVQDTSRDQYTLITTDSMEKYSAAIKNANPIDSIETISFNRYNDVIQVGKILGDKIKKSPVKSQAWFCLLSELMTNCIPKMEQKDLIALQNKMKSLLIQTSSSRNINALGKRKANEGGKNSIRYIQEELNDLNDYDDVSSGSGSYSYDRIDNINNEDDEDGFM